MKDNLKNIGHRTALDYRQRVCRAMNFISNNLEHDPPLEEIAAAASFSMYHFHRIFKAVTGETVSGFTRRLRLEWAANRLLGNPREDITMIAIGCGFSSSQNFAKAFRQQFAMSPSEYRNSKRGNEISKDGNAASLRTEYNPDSSFFTEVASAEGSCFMNAEVKTMPEHRVAYIRKMGPYGKETCTPAFEELAQWAGPRGYLQTRGMMGVYWDNPEVTPPEKCRMDACVAVPDGVEPESPAAVQTVAGGSYAVCHFEITGDSFQQAWEDAFKWVVSSGLECDDRPCYELYHNCAEQHPEGKWIFDICIPLKQP